MLTHAVCARGSPSNVFSIQYMGKNMRGIPSLHDSTIHSLGRIMCETKDFLAIVRFLRALGWPVVARFYATEPTVGWRVIPKTFFR